MQAANEEKIGIESHLNIFQVARATRPTV